jgi:hypothetical protein
MSYKNDHVDKERARQIRFRSEHTARGLCQKCYQPALPGRKLCQKHLDYHRNVSEKYRKAINWKTKGKRAIPAKVMEKILS